MKLPRDYTLYQLRGKHGRRHIILYQTIQHVESNWRWEPAQKIIGPVAWYGRKRGEKWKRLTDWLAYW